MKIAFLGLNGTFDYYQIGGTDSFIRRLIDGLLCLNKDLEISCIYYNSSELSKIRHGPRFTSKYFPTFKEALHHISTSRYFHVITVYLLPKDRLNFAGFRKDMSSVTFHNIVFFYPDSIIKRFLKFSEHYLFPYNGKTFCVSRRQFRYLKRITKNVVYLPPPVPEDYFLSLHEKPENEKIKITFLGRIDHRKGIEEVIHLFDEMNDDPLFECAIYGIVIPQDKNVLDIHNRLRSQFKIKFIELNRGAYSPEVDCMVKSVLKASDIFIQPYKTLDSTVDTPLLLLEAMASLCAVITTPLGNITEIYGRSDFVIDKNNFLSNAVKLLKGISVNSLKRERKRIYDLNMALRVRQEQVSGKFLDALQ